MSNMENIQKTKLAKVSIREQWGRLIALISLIAIALGSFNDSMDAIEKIYDFSMSQFTDIPSQNKLNHIYVRASSEVLTENLGAPVYIKRSSEGYTIQYFRDSRFILSAVIKDEAIAAYLVFPSYGFLPDTTLSSGGKDLLTTPFSDQDGVSDLRASQSRILTYYIEENTNSEYDNLYTSINGYSEFTEVLTDVQNRDLQKLVNDLTFGNSIIQSVKALRLSLSPNFYGYSSLGLSALEDAILTKSEYQLIKP